MEEIVIESEVEMREMRETPFEKFAFIWNNINYSVEVEDEKENNKPICSRKKKKLQLLDNLTGFCKSGEVTAIMGPSGAGKFQT